MRQGSHISLFMLVFGSLYVFAFDLGLAGLLGMVVTGAGRGGSHTGGHAGGGGHGLGHGVGQGAHSGHVSHPGHVGHLPVTHGVRGSSGPHGGGRGTGMRSRLLGVLSVRMWFSVLLGFGACGLLFKGLVPLEPWRFAVAAVGALFWERLLMTPMWNLCFAFASKPGRTLESAVAEIGEALTGFDADGCGLVGVILEGHEMHVLGHLAVPPEGTVWKVHRGDRLFVESVDTVHNSCVVSPLEGAPAPVTTP